MEKKLAFAISVVFQPVFVPLYSLILLFNADTYLTYAVHPDIKLAVYAITVFNTILVPSAIFYYFLKAGIIESFHMHTAKERSLPFLTTIVFHLSTLYLFTRMPVPTLFSDLVLGAIASVAVAFIINLKWKVSIHMLGMGGLVGTIIGLVLRYQVNELPLIMMLIMLSGLVGYSRLKLDAHTPLQVYVGFILGTLILTGSVVFP
ncbi:MAG: membrane-associated phospholipid phosphatase [Bacteroidia bacterium]|jgi:membrane-associated phospholipid phosphatase